LSLMFSLLTYKRQEAKQKKDFRW